MTNVQRNYFSRCCCFFKRKKKKSTRQKWLEAVQCSPEREAVTLLRATSHSNSRDSVVNQSQDFIQASSHTLRYPSASVLTTTPTNTPTLPLWIQTTTTTTNRIKKKRKKLPRYCRCYFLSKECREILKAKKN